ncbi:MAG: hypothetical protein M3N12_10735, partial [Verrucomicrobiota bacterium]|nr:hypothetical protein [Verrucomicrobiota bacterium]
AIIFKNASRFFGPILCASLLLCAPFRLGADWVAVGPAPAINGQDEGITSPEGDNPVAGAINAIAASATDANLIYVASVNGGVWKTTNGKAASPTWTPLTDQALPSLSLSSIAISPLDPKVIFAGAGRVSSLGNNGGKLFGIARSADSGATWTVVGPNLADRNIRSIVPTRTLENGNQVVLVGSNSGIFRSVDGGMTYALVTNGIPSDDFSDVVADPSASTRFYAGSNGTMYRSDDTGATWVTVNGNGFNVVQGARILLSVHSSQGNSVVYAAVIDGGALANVYRSADQGATWTALGVPAPPLFPGRQGQGQGAIVADKTDPNTVWISGDRQPDGTELGGMTQFPNPNGANNYSGNIFRNVGGAWQLMVLNGANGTSPHADSRAMMFDADGNILHACDGGIFKLNEPNLASRRWSSINGDIKVTEAHSGTYDPVSKNFMAGAQDNGVSFQRTAGNLVWAQAAQGDGGRVAADADQTAHAGTSLRYYSTQNFGNFSRRTYDANGVQVGNTAFPALMITAGAGANQTLMQFDKTIQFTQPYVLNQIDPRRLLIGTSNIYESLDMGETLNNLGAAGATVGDETNTGSSPMTYGSRFNGAAFPDVFYVGAGNRIVHRVTAGGALTTLTYPGDIVRGIVMDPQNYKRVFVLDSVNKVYGSADEGATWTELTGNLATFTDSIRAIELFNPDASFSKAVLHVGGAGGVWQLPNPTAAGGTWTVVAAGMPKVLVYELHYDYASGVLAASTLGRGVFTLGPNTTGIVANFSTRLPVGTDDNVLIEGFIVQGPAGSTKKIIVRALGPFLAACCGVGDALANPTLEIRDENNAIVATNNDWKITQVGGLITGDQVAEITASTVAPTNDLESAIIANLPPGSYTAVVRGVSNSVGTAVVDAYDLSAGSAARLVNIATRGLIQPGDKLMIAGFIIQNGPVRAVVRAIGPSLLAFGINNALPDTTLQLRNQNGTIVRENDDWKTDQQQDLINTGLQPTNDKEAALVETLQPGQYTAQVRGKPEATGTGVVQVYFLQ